MCLPPPDHLESAREAIRHLLRVRLALTRTWLSLLGILSSLEKLVPLGCLHIHLVHFCLRWQFAIRVHCLSCQVVLEAAAETALRWWLPSQHLEAGAPLGHFHPEITLYTDASTHHWGVHPVGFWAAGSWSREERTLSINCLELLAVIRALHTDPLHSGGASASWWHLTTPQQRHISTTNGAHAP